MVIDEVRRDFSPSIIVLPTHSHTNLHAFTHPAIDLFTQTNSLNYISAYARTHSHIHIREHIHTPLERNREIETDFDS